MGFKATFALADPTRRTRSYQSIANTIVQLFSPRASSLIEDGRRGRWSKQTTGNATSACHEPSPHVCSCDGHFAGTCLWIQPGSSLPVKDGKLQSAGRLGKEPDESVGRDALRTATLNAFSAAKAHVGSLDRMPRVISVKVYLATHGDFYNQPIVADAVSDVLRDLFGEDKMSVRSVLGVTALPLGAPVTLEVMFEEQLRKRGLSSCFFLQNT